MAIMIYISFIYLSAAMAAAAAIAAVTTTAKIMAAFV